MERNQPEQDNPSGELPKGWSTRYADLRGMVLGALQPQYDFTREQLWRYDTSVSCPREIASLTHLIGELAMNDAEGGKAGTLTRLGLIRAAQEAVELIQQSETRLENWSFREVMDMAIDWLESGLPESVRADPSQFDCAQIQTRELAASLYRDFKQLCAPREE